MQVLEWSPKYPPLLHLYNAPWLASRCSLTRMMLTPCCCLGNWFSASSTAQQKWQADIQTA
jgi:hypothetical protein